MWYTKEEWRDMGIGFEQAKAVRCATVESFQPCAVADRKATIRYALLVVLREESKFVKKRNMICQTNNPSMDKDHQQQQQQHPSDENHIVPCIQCYQNQLASLYQAATQKSRDKAYLNGRRCEAEVNGYPLAVCSGRAIPRSNNRTILAAIFA
jgi:hypothetical protein